MSCEDKKPDIAIVTGGGAEYQQYVQACLNSIYVNNNAGFNVYVLDMGFTPQFKDWLQLHPSNPTVLDISNFDPYQHLLKGRTFCPPDIGYIRGMVNSFRKLIAFDLIKEKYFYWLDADTLLLGDISKIVPDLDDAKIYASRSPRRDFDKLLTESPEILFEKQLRKRPLQPQIQKIVEKYPDIAQRLLGFNAGVVLADREWFVASSERHGHFFLENFSDSIFADQGYMNLVMAADGESVFPLPLGVNCSPTDDRLSFSVDFQSSAHPIATLSGVKVLILHFLGESKPPLTTIELDDVLNSGESWKQSAVKLYLYFKDIDLNTAPQLS